MVNFWTLQPPCLGGQHARDSHPALIDQHGTVISYGKLAELADAWGAQMQAALGGRSGLAMVEIEVSVDAIAAYLGALRADIPVVVVEVGKAAPTSRLVQTYQPELVMRRDDPDAEYTMTVSAPTEAFPAAHPDLKALLSTSGSTGDPKLVRLSAENIATNAEAIVQILDITPQDRAMIALPLHFVYGLSVLTSYLAAGGTLVLNGLSVVDADFWQMFRTHDCTSVALVPHQFYLLEHSGFLDKIPQQCPTLRYVTQSGARLEPATAKRFTEASRRQGWELYMMYGQTEAAGRVAYVPPEALPEAADTIGQAIPGGRLWISGPSGQEVMTANTRGEMVFEGPNVMMGYATQRAELALGREVTDLRTGDIAERTPDGLFRIVGRIKRFVKLFGKRLSLDQIEAMLGHHAIPAEAVEVNDRLVILHHDPAQGAAAQTLIADEYDLPLSVIHTHPLDKLPLLPSGKPDRKALTKLAEVALEEEAGAAPTSADLATVLGQATRQTSVGPNDSFVSLGGDSLSYLQVQLALEERLGVVPEGWEHMKLSQLEALEPQEGGRQGWRALTIDVPLRLLAICFVIIQHTSSFDVSGGTWVLILLMGFSAGRFRKQAILDGQPLKVGWPMLYPFLPLYLALVLVYAVLRGTPMPEDIMLVSNYMLQDHSNLLTAYWFVSFYVQVVLVLVLISVVPAARGALARYPLGMPIGLSVLMLGLFSLGIGAGAYQGSIGQWPVPRLGIRGLYENLPLFFAGWLLSDPSKRGILPGLALTAVTALLFVALDTKPMVIVLMCSAAVMVAMRVQIPMPARLSRGLQQLAGLTMFVYLLHIIVIFVVSDYGLIPLPDVPRVIVSIILSFAVAAVAKRFFERFEPRLRARLQRSSGRLRQESERTA